MLEENLLASVVHLDTAGDDVIVAGGVVLYVAVLAEHPVFVHRPCGGEAVFSVREVEEELRRVLDGTAQVEREGLTFCGRDGHGLCGYSCRRHGKRQVVSAASSDRGGDGIVEVRGRHADAKGVSVVQVLQRKGLYGSCGSQSEVIGER